MDKQWIWERNRLSKRYTDGIQSFMEAASQHVNDKNETKCPCMKCQNMQLHDLATVHAHLWKNGMSVVYHTWIYHGESFEIPTQTSNLPSGSDNYVHDMLNDRFPRDMDHDPHGEDIMGDDYESNVHRVEAGKYEKLMVEAERELFPGTRGCSVLTFMVQLMLNKVENHWTNKSFDTMLEIWSSACPKPHNIPPSYYATNKMLKDLGLGFEKIDACKYDCALFYKEHENKDKCPECDEPRYKPSTSVKRKKVPQKVLRYFPLKPRLQRLFMSKNTAAYMRWHANKRVDEEGVMRHPADSIAWKEFDLIYPEFAQEPRNIRLGLATDGFNPFGNMSLSYSMWPVIVVPYNLPPWMCMKAQYSMMTLLIPGPKAPSKDIDVYLRPLVDELKELWEQAPKGFWHVLDGAPKLSETVEKLCDIVKQLQAGINDRSRKKRKRNSKYNGKGPRLQPDSSDSDSDSASDDSTTNHHGDNLQGGGDGLYNGLEDIGHGH
ncbi:uncharacterized protein LOC110754366 [Prunus avium]|uniref:Uncharacterized protein LOC110754366 n=1 Tax=Prunus avium TaxID=42229 RepID=A0A6P5S9J6_PRUAV|nr:uncharacterized protein LOC110754366 [Prunus avium]